MLTRKTLAFIGSCIACTAHGASARAQESQATYGAYARIRPPSAATSDEDASASGTALEVDARLSALESVAEVIADAPGARIESTGGLGASSGVALRGAGIAHTTVLLGDIPLSSADTGPFDLSIVPLPALEAVEIYRGGTPVWWSDGAIGGVVRLVPKRAKQRYLQARAGAGSFGRFELSASSSLVLDRGSLLSIIHYARADNDYRYRDDNQTRFRSDDDTALQQQNAEIDTGSGLMHAGIELFGGRLDIIASGHGRIEGVPGPLAAPTDHVSRKLVRVLGGLAFTRQGAARDGSRTYRVQALASASHQTNQLTDLDGELGLTRASVSDDEWSRAYGRLAGSVAVTSFLEPTLVLSAARDDHRPNDPLAFSVPSRPSGRSTRAVAFEPRLHGALGDVPLELRPSIRGQWTEASIWVSSDAIEMRRREQRGDALVTYRIAGLIMPAPPLALAASFSTGARVPSILELFGDRVFQIANVELKPERSRTAEVSAVLKGHAGSFRGSVELRSFVLFIDDLINHVRTSQYAVRAENIEHAEISGAELGISGALGRHFALHGAVTAMRTRNQFDREVPLRPPLLAQARPEVFLFPPFADRIALFAEIEHTSFMYLDPANRTLLAGRTLISIGGMIELFSERLTLSARVQNLTDQAATDVLSRPLPGIQALFSVSGQSSLF